jgi:Mg2+-importing ATPase
LLAWSTAAVALFALALPFIGPLARVFGFVALPAPVVAVLLAVVLAYVLATEATKRWFFARRGGRTHAT